MGMSAGGGSGGHGARRRRRSHVMSEINVTPMVDVMLVLLIIFMVAAPMLTVGVPIEMPQTSANPLNEEKEPLTITIDQKGGVFLQETPIDVSELAPRLIAITNSGYEERIYVRGDKNVNFGQVAKVMGALSGAGFKRVALVTEQEQGS
jgi:biopolymer transport protein TolR